jgi:hypothetical protein
MADSELDPWMLTTTPKACAKQDGTLRFKITLHRRGKMKKPGWLATRAKSQREEN